MKPSTRTGVVVALLALALPLAAVAPAAAPAHAAADCSFTYSGRVPLTDLGTGTYQGKQGGLYPGGSNTRPGGHDAAGVHLATTVVKPRNPAGAVDTTNGKIVMISIGMSNTTQEFQRFIQLANADPARNPKLVIVDGAQGSQDAAAWADPAGAPWTVLAQRLSAAGVSAAQVQTVWLKEQMAGDNLGTFPGGAQNLRDALASIVRNARTKYPNLRIAHLSSRAYTYDPTRSQGAYEQAFAVKWLIEDQINGAPSLAYSGPGAVAPWLAWAPYLWADGLGPDRAPGGIPGRSDGLEWTCSNFENDGVHPSSSGEQKVASMLLPFYKSDTTATPWFRR
jgi:hypothetical protein